MSYDPILLAPWDSPQSGLFTYYKPWLIGNDAFPQIEDAYIWRGAIRKREGYKLLGTLPTVPVQALTNYNIPATGDINLIAFSTTKAYRYNNGTGIFDNISFFSDASAVSWTGTISNFFSWGNFANALWVVNNVDPLRFWNGSAANGWNNQRPILHVNPVGPVTTRLQTALMVFPYKGRLVLLNTTEVIDPAITGGTVFRNRARWSQIGTPYVPAFGAEPPTVPPIPFTTDANAWRDDIPGRGGFIDADTNERIISAGIIRDTLIVFFNRSTWKLRYTGNEILPFIWERLNTQYGSESTNSSVPFDDTILTFSRFGFIGSDTNSVDRIDEKIPDQTFFNMEFGTTTDDLQRVHGIRDYYRQTAYWCYEYLNSTSGLNNRVLAYNYLQKSWAIYNQPFRCFGYYNTFNDTTWALATFTWESATNMTWQGVTQAQFPQVVAGDANTASGNVYIVYDLTSDATDNGTNFGYNIFTKNFNPYMQEGARAKLAYVDLYTSPTDGGEITVNHYVDDNPNIVLTRTVNINTLNNSKYTRIFLGAIGRTHQLQFTLTPAQIADANKGLVQFELQGAVFWFRKEGRIKS